MIDLTLQHLLAPSGGHAVVHYTLVLVQADWLHVNVKVDVLGQVQNRHIVLQGARVELWMVLYRLDAHNLEWSRFNVRAQLPFTCLDEDVVGALSGKVKNKS